MRPALAASVLLSGFGPHLAPAATLTWTGGGATDNWSDTANWSGSFPSAGDTLIFAGSTRLSPSNDVNVKATLEFASGAGAFTLVGNQELPTTGITNLSSNMQTIGGTSRVSVTDNQTWDAGTAGLTVSAPIFFDFWRNSSDTLTITGSGNTYLNGNISFSGSPWNHGSITKTGSGTLFLNGSNSYWGKTTVEAGTVVNGTGGGLVDNSPFTVNGGTLDLNGYDLTMSSLWGTGGIVDLGSAALTVSQGGYAGSISGTGGLFKSGSGTLTLSGNNTYDGGTTINAGTLSISSDSHFGAAGGGLTFDGGTLQTTASFTTTRTTTLNAGGGRFNTDATTTLTHRGDITGSGALTKLGDGTLLLKGSNNYSGGTTVSGGTLQGDSDSLKGNILNNAAVIFNEVGSGLYAGEMSGSGSLTKIGGGDLELTGTNTYSGGTTVSDGALRGDTDSLQGSIVNNATVIFEQATDGTYAGDMSGSGSLNKTGARILTLSGNNDYSGGTLVSGGTLRGDSDSLQGNILNSAAVVFDQADDGTYAEVMSGTGSLIKQGAGTLTLTGTNTYTGGTTISAGTLLIDGGVIQGDTINNGALVFNSSSINYAGDISGTGSFTKQTASTLRLTGTNTYSGGTTISGGNLIVGDGSTNGAITGDIVNNSTLAFNHSDDRVYGDSISGTGSFFKQGTGTLKLTGTNTQDGGITIDNGTLQIGNGGTTGSLAGDITNNSALIFNRSDTLSYGGDISGSGSLTKTGSGELVLTGDHAYTGATTIEAGLFTVNGSVAGDVQVESGATLGGSGSIGGAVTVDGRLAAGNSPGTLSVDSLILNAGSTSTFELGAPGVVGGSDNDWVQVSGDLNLGGTLDAQVDAAGYYRLFNYGGTLSGSFASDSPTSTNEAFTVASSEVLTNIDGEVNYRVLGTDQLMQFWDGTDTSADGSVGGGAATWDSASTNWTGHPGKAEINDSWQSSVGVFSGTAGTVTVSGTQSFDTLQFSTDGYRLSGGNLALAPASGSTATFNVDGGITATVDSTLTDGSGNSLSKLGSGTLVLTGANTYSGGTTITGGTLQGDTSSLQGDITNGAALVFDQGTDGNYAGSISGTGSLTKTGTGTVTLSGTNTYSGGTTVAAGTLQGDTASLQGDITNDAALVFNQNADGTYAGNISGTGSLTKTGTGTVTLSGTNTYSGGTTVAAGTLQGDTASLQGDITNDAALVFNQSADGTYAGSISGTGVLTKTGNGTLVLTGTHTYSGGTNVSAGVLRSDSDSLQGNIENNAALVFDQASIGTYSGEISGSGSLTKSGGGTLTLTGSNTHTGGTTLRGGTLRIVADAGLGDSAASLTFNGGTLNTFADISMSRATTVNAGGGTFDTDAGTTLTHSSAITGSGALTKTGSGTLVLTGTNTYSGGTTVSAGTLQGDTTSLQGDIANDAAIVFNQSSDGSYAGAINGSGSVTKTGSGTLTLSGANSYSGGTTVSAGTLRGDTGSLQGDILNNAAVIFDLATDGTYAGDMSGNGSLTKTGAGVLTLTGTNAYSGSTTVSAGVLKGNTASLQGDIDNRAAVVFDQTVDGTYAGNMSGNGALTKTGAGTLTLTGPHTYSGGTNVSAGTLRGDATSLQGNIVNNAAVFFDQATDGTYAGDMSGSGTLTKTGAGTLTLAGNNGYTGDITLNGGTLSIGSAANLGATLGQLNVDNARLQTTGTFNVERTTTLGAGGATFDTGTGTTLTFDGAIDGVGGLVKAGDGTLVLAGLNTYTGDTTVSTGTLRVNGSVTSAMTVDSGATLGGSGAITGNVNVAGTLAPGNSPGLLTVNGDLTLNPGSVTRMEIDGTARGSEYDALDVSGTAALDGTLDLVFGYVPVDGDRYRLINAGSFVRNGDAANGFAEITSNLGDALLATPVIDPATYDILIELSQQSYVATAGDLTGNQRAVATSLDTFSTSGQAADLIAALNTLGAGQLPTAFDGLSGVQHASAQQLMLGNRGALQRLLGNRGQRLAANPGRMAKQAAVTPVRLAYGGDLSELQLATNGPLSPATEQNGSGFWLRPQAGTGEIESTANSTGIDYRDYGLYGGFDRWLDNRRLVGVALGYTRTDGDPVAGDQQFDSAELALYGRWQGEENYLAASVSAGYHQAEVSRQVTLGNTVSAARGDYDARSRGLAVEAGHAWALTEATRLTPFVGLDYARLERDGFAETGGGQANLTVAAETGESLRSRLGLRLSHDSGGVSTDLEAAWAREHEDRHTTLHAGFSAAPGALFTVAGPELDRDRLQVGAGISTRLGQGTTLRLGYEGEIADSDQWHSVSAMFIMRW